MRWPCRRRPVRPSSEAEHALSQAGRAMVDAQRLDDAVQEVTAKLRATRARNHFAEAVTRTIRGT